MRVVDQCSILYVIQYIMSKIEKILIAKARQIAVSNCFDYADYDDENEPIDNIADALTILVDDQMDLDCDIDSSEFYDFFKEKLG